MKRELCHSGRGRVRMLVLIASLAWLLAPCHGHAATPAGRVLPRLELPDLSGKFVPLARPGELTVINFWATWCPPCLEEIPELVRLHKRWRERGVRLIGVAVDSGEPADVGKFARAHDIGYPVLMAGRDWVRAHFGIIGIPVTLVIDQDRKVRVRLVGPQTAADFVRAVQPLVEDQG